MPQEKVDIVGKEAKMTQEMIEKEKIKTAITKVNFINEIKHGLGEDIKSNPNKVTIIKRPWHYKLKMFLKQLFTKF